MKKSKVLSILLASAMVLTTVGCGSNGNDTSSNNAGGSTSDSSQSTDDSGSAGSTDDSGSAGSTAAGDLDTSERVDLVFYVMGDAPPR